MKKRNTIKRAVTLFAITILIVIVGSNQITGTLAAVSTAQTITSSGTISQTLIHANNISLAALLQWWSPTNFSSQEWQSTTGTQLNQICNIAYFGNPNTTTSSSVQFIPAMTRILPNLKNDSVTGVILTWDMIPNGDCRTNTTVIQQVANGSYDNAIRTNADWLNDNFPYPLIIRMNQEMNVNTWGWSQNATTFIQAWQRVVNIFRAEGCDVQWAWTPNWIDYPYSGADRISFQSYYPGDEYVDWIGTDIYADPVNNLNASRQLSWTNQDGLNIYQFSVDHNKQFLIGEWGPHSTMTDKQNADWLSGLLNALALRPNCKLICQWCVSPYGLLSKDAIGNYLYPQTISVYKQTVSRL